MTRRANSAHQPDLLDWQPAEPVTRFDETLVRASSIAGRVCRGVSVALKEAAARGLSREHIAQAMSDYLDESVSKNMLDAYASQAREEHIINVVRFIALVHATGDRRLLEMIAQMFGWSVIEERYLPLIELAQVREKEDELKRHSEALRRRARAGGLV